jgi:hypothetical protein
VRSHAPGVANLIDQKAPWKYSRIGMKCDEKFRLGAQVKVREYKQTETDTK